MKNFIYVFFTITLFTCCLTLKKAKQSKSVNSNNTRNSTCDSLKHFLAKNWKYNDSLNVYFCDEKKIFDEMQVHKGYQGNYWKCMSQLTKKSSIELFGKPNENLTSELRYYLNAKCFNGMGSGCMFLCFYFDKDSIFQESIITWVTKQN